MVGSKSCLGGVWFDPYGSGTHNATTQRDIRGEAVQRRQEAAAVTRSRAFAEPSGWAGGTRLGIVRGSISIAGDRCGVGIT